MIAWAITIVLCWALVYAGVRIERRWPKTRAEESPSDGAVETQERDV